ncbi:MAG: hypothetical protein E6J90_52765 [Deltaproteobacteria bacterium]|nr:MAG: hypothetical protein E6J90_52765 [Deltaproteobacteria bacterium]
MVGAVLGAYLWLASSGCREDQARFAPSGPVQPDRGPILPAQVDCKKLHYNWEQLASVGDPVPLQASMGNCPVAGCGLNGVWLGSGVQFRTLHTTAGALNPQRVRIREFKKGSDVLRLQVTGQELQGIMRDSSVILQGEELIGSQLWLEHVDPTGHVEPYLLRAPPRARLYSFTVRAGDGCEVQLCRPGLDDSYHGNLDGTAVIFRGDYYDETSHRVFTTPQNTYDEDVFNIACIGTAISKLHMLRHTTAADPARPRPAPTHLTFAEERQTLLRLLTADYCGTGGSFTEEGLPIWLDFNHERWQPTSGSRYVPGPMPTIEARWAPNGASCLLVPRLPTTDRSRVDAVCRAARRSPPSPSCPLPWDPERAVTHGNYAISWTSTTP